MRRWEEGERSVIRGEAWEEGLLQRAAGVCVRHAAVGIEDAGA